MTCGVFGADEKGWMGRKPGRSHGGEEEGGGCVRGREGAHPIDGRRALLCVDRVFRHLATRVLRTVAWRGMPDDLGDEFAIYVSITNR